MVWLPCHRRASWLDEDVRLHHLRDRDGVEVDLVIERSDGEVVAVEVKASSTVGPGDGDRPRGHWHSVAIEGQ